ncbi:Metaxin-3 [Sarcoptes scabiei]|uniref:Metaxin-3 n=1 Tax=Sarcoptes scabiei TaxID=52283 RepID=A0A132AKY5_SARSC|nr:Metaxin-3 [Sarcoptes scabiei]KPM11614.1 metaxin-like protein [Sarcoptes scabiei]
MNQKYRLDIVGGKFRLPSIDQDCLTVLTYCTLAGIQLEINTISPFQSKSPSLHIDNQIVFGADKIIEYLESVFYNSDMSKNSAQHKFQFKSYQNYLKVKLEPCLQYLFWYDEQNYNENIGSWIAEKCSFPFNLIAPRMIRKSSINQLMKCFPIKVLEDANQIKVIEKKVIANAIECIQMLTIALGDNLYLLGEKPSKIDSYLFSYLAMLYELPVKKEIIKSQIRLSPNLKQFVERILQKFPIELKSLVSNDQDANQDTSGLVNWFDVFFSGSIAGLLMIYFAFASGLIKPESYEEDDEDDREENDK